MAKNITNVNTSDTFQQWVDKTNEMATAFRTDVVTTGSSDTAAGGNAAITGNFTAATFLGDVRTDTISSETASATIQINSPIKINGPSQTTAIFSNGTGGQAQFTNGSITWDVGLENSGGNFIIDTGAGANKFQLSTAGTLTVPNIVVTDSISANTLSIGSGGSGINSDDITEGTTNLYFTDARAIAAFTGGDGINVASDGTISFDGDGQLQTYTGNEFIPTGTVGSGIRAYMDGGQNVGVPYGRLRTEWSSNTYDVLTWVPSGISVNGYGHFTDDVRITDGDLVVRNANNDIVAFTDSNGNGVFAGDVTSAYSSSDERLKDNLKIIQHPLDKIDQINGYTFNYKDKPRETVPGVIAQEVEKVLPGVVYDHEKNGETYKAVRYDQIIPLLVESIKELKEKVNDLEGKLNS